MDKYKYMKEKMLKTMCPILCVIANISDWLKKNWAIAIVNWAIAIVIAFAISAFLLDCFLFFRFEATTLFLGIDYNQIVDAQWDMIRTVGYAGGVLLLVIQIIISNRRATALEKSAEAALASNVEQRYHNAINSLKETSSFIRIGAIYNLYHLSQSTDTYDATIFDIFCEYIKRDQNNINAKEKQIIVDKLFRENKDNRVLKDPKTIDLTGANLTGADLTEADLTKADLTGADLTGADLTKADLTKADLTEANLTGANLTGANLTGANLTGANLTEADLTEADLTGANLTEAIIPSAWTQWEKIKNLQGVKLDGIKQSSANMTNLNLREASLKNTSMIYVDFLNTDLTGADLTGADLTDTAGLTFDQLSKVKCVHGVKGLDAGIEARLKEEKSELFDKLNNI